MARARISVSAPLLRLRSDDQLVALFRAGNDDAFRAIHDRYRPRLFAYTKQMLPGSMQDAEDALQDVFVRAYSGLRANGRELTLRPWLYRVAHNRCVDELRRPLPPTPEALHQASVPTLDPAARVEQRESLQRLITDLRRLPDQQRSALLMRELGGMTYADIAVALGVSVPAIKSLLVRARIGLALAAEARDTACVEIRDELTLAHDRGVRPSGNARRHLADCDGCREFRAEVRRSRRQFAALVPAFGPMGLLANLLGIGGGAGGAGAAATGGATATTGAAVGGGTAATVGTLAAGASHVATLIAAAVVTAGGAVALQSTVAPTHHRRALHVHSSVAQDTASGTPASPYQTERASVPGTEAAAPTPASGRPARSRAGIVASGADTTSSPATLVSGGDNVVPTASAPSGATTSTATGTADQPTNGTATPTGASLTGATDPPTCKTSTPPPSGCTTGSSSSTGSTGGSATTGAGATGAAGTNTGPGTSSSIGGGNPSAGTGATGPVSGASTGTPTGTPPTGT